jgi:hypothetical protein
VADHRLPDNFGSCDYVLRGGEAEDRWPRKFQCDVCVRAQTERDVIVRAQEQKARNDEKKREAQRRAEEQRVLDESKLCASQLAEAVSQREADRYADESNKRHRWEEEQREHYERERPKEIEQEERVRVALQEHQRLEVNKKRCQPGSTRIGISAFFQRG